MNWDTSEAVTTTKETFHVQEPIGLFISMLCYAVKTCSTCPRFQINATKDSHDE